MVGKEGQKGKMSVEQTFKAEIKSAKRKSEEEALEPILFQEFMLRVVKEERKESIRSMLLYHRGEIPLEASLFGSPNIVEEIEQLFDASPS